MLFQIEDFSYDSLNGIITRSGVEHKLTKIQNNLFNYFISHPNTILSKQTLMVEVWGRIITENSVDQFISILRKYIENDPKNPTILVTHFGKGISFVGSIIEQRPVQLDDTNTKKSKVSKRLITIFGYLMIVSLGLIYFNFTPQKNLLDNKNIIQNNKILVLPLDFEGNVFSQVEKLGMDNILQSSFNLLNTEGEIIFDNSSLSTKQSIEKHWRIDKNLTVLHTNVIKNGEIYEATMQLTNGSIIIEKETIKTDNINKLLQNQIAFLGGYQELNDSRHLNINDDEIQLFISAMGYKKLGEFKKSEDLLNQILSKNSLNYQARYEIAKIFILNKEYDRSIAQLNTLKSTNAYQQIGAEIELSLAEIKYQKHENESLVNDLIQYQSNHLDISNLKKAKIKLMLAKAYLDMGDVKNSMKYYQQSIIGINEQLNPSLYAQSFLGQGRVLLNQSNNENVNSYFEKSLEYANQAGDLQLQIYALNSLSEIKMAAYQWDDAIALIKQSVELLELSNNTTDTAVSLGNLVALLNQRGHFSEAKQVNLRLGKIAEEINSDTLRLQHHFYNAILAMNFFNWDYAKSEIDKHMKLSIETKNYSMQLNNAFILMELILIKHDTVSFKPEWDKRTALIKKLGFERFQVYMDLYLARYYKQMNQYDDAIELINKVSEQATANNDIKMIVDAHNQLAEIYLKSDAKKALDLLNNLNQYNPHPNPYLELKAKALNKLGDNIEALNVLNQAKLAYNESWTTETQSLLELVEKQLKN